MTSQSDNYSYPIVEWDPVVDQQGTTSVSIMFKPDLKALDLFNQAPLHRVIVSITDSDMTEINGQKLFVTIDKSSQIPDHRANLFDGSGLYTLVLPVPWTRYPTDRSGILHLEHKEMKGIIQEMKMVKGATPSPQSVLSSTKVDRPIVSKPLLASSDPKPNSIYEYKDSVRIKPKNQTVFRADKDSTPLPMPCPSVERDHGMNQSNKLLIALIIVLISYILYKH